MHKLLPFLSRPRFTTAIYFPFSSLFLSRSHPFPHPLKNPHLSDSGLCLPNPKRPDIIISFSFSFSFSRLPHSYMFLIVFTFASIYFFIFFSLSSERAPNIFKFKQTPPKNSISLEISKNLLKNAFPKPYEKKKTIFSCFPVNFIFLNVFVHCRMKFLYNVYAYNIVKCRRFRA